MAKLEEARKKNIGEVDFIDEDGKRVRILLPGRVDSDFVETS